MNIDLLLEHIDNLSLQDREIILNRLQEGRRIEPRVIEINIDDWWRGKPKKQWLITNINNVRPDSARELHTIQELIDLYNRIHGPTTFILQEITAADRDRIRQREEEHQQRREEWERLRRQQKLEQMLRRQVIEEERQQRLRAIEQEHQQILQENEQRRRRIDELLNNRRTLLDDILNNRTPRFRELSGEATRFSIIPVFEHDSVFVRDIEDDDEHQCYICQETDRINLKKCGNCEGCVHIGCIRRWYQNSGNTRCGYCRQSLRF